MDRIVYYDNAATGRPLQSVIEALSNTMKNNWYNASATYSTAYDSGRIIRKAKEKIAGLINASGENLIITSGATESNNMVLKSFATLSQEPIHIISSSIEHPATSETLNELRKYGHEISLIGVDENGVVKLEELTKAIRHNTTLISIMYANNETGVIQPIKEIVNIAHTHNIPVHSDAVQAVGHISVDVENLDIDYLSASAHKMNGPKGIGFLYVKEGKKINPLIRGGGQQKNRRSGTENTEGCAGFAAAAEYHRNNLTHNYSETVAVRDYIENRLMTELENVSVNGGMTARVPGISNIRIAGIEAEALIMRLDMKGICISGGSACSSRDGKPSKVLKSMGLSDYDCMGCIRISLSHENTLEEAKYATGIIIDTVKEIRKMRF